MALNLGQGMLFQNSELKYEESLKDRWQQESSTPYTLTGGPGNLHTVAAGKKFYVTSFIVSSYNVEGQQTISLKDNSTTKFSFIYPASMAAQTFSFTFATPLEFSTNVTLTVSGDNFYNNTIIGWEE